MWYNDERPHNFDEVKGQEDIVTGIRSQSIRDKFFQIYIFGGQYGGGKTTMARIVSLAANCQHKDEHGNPCLECEACKAILEGRCQDVVEMDGASNTSVDDVRALKESIEYLPTEVRKKVYIIDEVHMLSKGAFNALLKLLEEPPKHVIIILCTTDVKMIPNTVKSRAAKYTFLPINSKVIKERIIEVAKRHDANIDDAAVELMAKNSHGSMRDAISLLEQAAEQSSGNITEDIVKDMLGLTDPVHLFSIINALSNNNIAQVVMDIDKFMELGKDSFLMITDMLDVLSDCIIAKYQGTQSICNSQQYIDCMSKLLSTIEVDSIYSIMNGLMDIRDELKRMPGKTTLVCGIIRMLSDEKGAYAKMAKRVEELERQIKDLNNGVFVSTTVSTCDQEVEESKTEKFVEDVDVESNPIQKQESNDTEKEAFGTAIEEEIPFIAQQDEEEDGIVDSEGILDDAEEQHVQQEAEIETKEEQGSIEESEEPKPVNTEEEIIDVNDPFAILNMFGGFIDTQTSEKKAKKVEEEEPKNTVVKTTDIESYLIALYADPVIENALEIGCTRTMVDGNVCFITEIEEIYQLIKAYDEVKQFPFLYKLAV